jgi:O-antigen/teichoic acid export membrane protein
MSLRRAAASAVKWKGAAAAIGQALQFVRLVILARLLVPEDFGLMAMITVIIGIAETFSDGGMNSAIIHRQDVTREQLTSLYWLNLAAGFVVFALVWALTPLVVALYHEPRLADLMFWAALLFLITPIGQQFRILLQKQLRFRRLAQVEVSAAVVGTVVAVWFALAGHGVFSLIWGQLATTLTTSMMCAKLEWKTCGPRLHFRLNDLRGFVGFGLYQIGSRTMNKLSANVDYLIIGRFLGAEALGFYMLAYRLVVTPLLKFNPMLTQVAFPVFARKQSDHAALRHGYLEMIRMVAFVTFPILVGVGATAPLLVPVVFGAKWLPAVPLIQILVALGILKTLTNPIGSLLLAKGRPDIGFKASLGALVINVCVFWNVVEYGAQAVALAYTLLTTAYFAGGLKMILHPLIGLRPVEYLAVLLRPMAVSVGMGVTVLGAYLALHHLWGSNTALLGMLAVLGIMVYGSLMVIFERQYLAENWRLLFHKQRRA